MFMCRRHTVYVRLRERGEGRQRPALLFFIELYRLNYACSHLPPGNIKDQGGGIFGTRGIIQRRRRERMKTKIFSSHSAVDVFFDSLDITISHKQKYIFVTIFFSML